MRIEKNYLFVRVDFLESDGLDPMSEPSHSCFMVRGRNLSEAKKMAASYLWGTDKGFIDGSKYIIVESPAAKVFTYDATPYQVAESYEGAHAAAASKSWHGAVPSPFFLSKIEI